MAELTQPLVTAKESTPKTDGAVRHSHGTDTTFAELVYLHFDWWKALRTGGTEPAIEKEYKSARHGFEARHGELVTAYWCSHVESAVALTHKRRRHVPWATPVPRFHRESDWATQNAPEIARELHRCDELAVKARTVLTGVRRLICMQLVVASASHLLSLVDARAAHADPAKTDEALKREQEALAEIDTYYKDAANGQAQIVYFAGMAVIGIAIAVVAAFRLTEQWERPTAAILAGALGAIVSVIQRINNGKFDLEYDVGRPYAFFLGGLRPIIGASFAVAISFAFTGGFLHLPVAEGTSDHRLALLVVAFVAGFSERWAQDTLVAAVPAPSGGEKKDDAKA
jgi:hypothetical protein